MKKIAVIPIDNRPICYDLIKDILAMDKNIQLFLPKLSSLGGLIKNSNVDEIFDFIEELDEIDYLIVSLDTIAYGGLVSSRRCSDSFDEIKNRIEKFKKIIQKKAKKILAFSSIMRISNNNINEEEKEYWAQWGKRIFDWSFYLHKTELEKSYNCVHNIIPKDILEDYLNTRKRNFEINKLYLSWAQEGFFDTLIFSKDDCAQYGLNVKEANELAQIIKTKEIKNAKIKTGADEIPLALIARVLNAQAKIKINPIFLEENSIDLISKYEDVSIKNCVLGQLELANCLIDIENYDLNLIINNFKNEQGDLVLGDIINSTDKEINFMQKPCFIADVNNANGADKKLIRQLFNQKLNNFYGYCGYNTSANTLGCVILSAIVKYLSLKNNSYNDFAFKKLQFVRFLDDWAYQAISRKYIRESAPEFKKALDEKTAELNENAQIISEFLNYYPKEVKYSLPWDRSFEIRIEIID
ncbi:MAG: DUF4127 family protein [Candidatus Gastranaerophilales bacterium]|nr:DUF4127 family protein [Candidatus Gastranaerophilales bacterium]